MAQGLTPLSIPPKPSLLADLPCPLRKAYFKLPSGESPRRKRATPLEQGRVPATQASCLRPERLLGSEEEPGNMEETPSLSPDEAHNILGVILENNTVIKREQNVHNKKETDMIKELRIKNRLATNTERRHGTVYRRNEKGPDVQPQGAAGLKPGVSTQQSTQQEQERGRESPRRHE